MGDYFDNVQRTHDAWPEKKLIFTEGCVEGASYIETWAQGERYARSIIADLHRWTVAWVDWNIVLDETGGPNYVNNLCAARVIAGTKMGTIHYHSSYY